jgi:catechol 2,3-dioxygenase-like lactoylglutathione lyase family enzyme
MSEASETKKIGVDGIGGVFLYANDAPALAHWYAKHFGLCLRDFGECKVYWMEFTHRGDEVTENPAEPSSQPVRSKRASVVFSIHAVGAPPLPGERREAMINWRVLDLAGFLEQLRAAGVAIEKSEDSEYGKFAWVRDPEGNRIELYQPATDP